MSEVAQPQDVGAEQNLLRLSIAVTLGLGALGLIAGLVIGSRSILFDGFYSVVDVAMTSLALIVSKLLTRDGSRRFQFGYWHFEPIVAAFNGTILTLSCIYAFFDAVSLLMQGGHRVEFGPAALYAIISCAVCLAMAVRMRRAGEALNSELLRVDARGFLIGGAVSLALLVSFLGAMALERANHGSLSPYVDPIVLAAVIVVLAPIPIMTVVRGVKEIFLVAPKALDQEVRRVLEAANVRHGFAGFTSYVAKTGRARFIDAYFLVPPGFPATSIEVFDHIRDEIAAELEEKETPLWLNISFTADRKWA
ncbi:cation diffusion facilitator family transporter [Methylocella silvestris BL2]|uniref:Cation diffusion facilitator family transporter n=1 Tax=Methylocella silvestris (strain DSM 15510 / CIP 108128 / LMG 27833 / NCIMB 13906 / BL2) TaxID=395965 RepID=B8EQQ8_METSB|nr:cation transporter [Methylocella silvestris]ACK49329.1 cation diffusion facilitator family transporter [Methylocella silvestris BL2]